MSSLACALEVGLLELHMLQRNSVLVLKLARWVCRRAMLLECENDDSGHADDGV